TPRRRGCTTPLPGAWFLASRQTPHRTPRASRPSRPQRVVTPESGRRFRTPADPVASIERVTQATESARDREARQTHGVAELDRDLTGGAEEVASERASRVTVIRPASRWPHLDVPELWHYRELLGTFVWRDVVVRYKQAFLGIAWALFLPAFTSAIYVIVFGKFGHFPAGSIKAYPSLVIAGVIPMQYFSSSLTASSSSL